MCPFFIDGLTALSQACDLLVLRMKAFGGSYSWVPIAAPPLPLAGGQPRQVGDEIGPAARPFGLDFQGMRQ